VPTDINDAPLSRAFFPFPERTTDLCVVRSKNAKVVFFIKLKAFLVSRLEDFEIPLIRHLHTSRNLEQSFALFGSRISKRPDLPLNIACRDLKYCKNN